MKLPHLVKQTLMRANTMIVVKSVGLAGKVFITRTMGVEGMGLYQLTYFFYALVLMIISGGLPTALAMYISSHPYKGWALFKKFSVIMLLIGAVCSLLTYLLSSRIASLLHYPQLDFAIRCLSPAIFAVPLLSLLRGYLQGLEKYGIIALSELVEQMVRIGSLVILIPIFISSGLQWAVGAAILGTSLGAMLAFAFIIVVMKYKQPGGSLSAALPDRNSGFLTVAKVSLIITLTRLLVPASDFVDAMIIPQRLQASGISSGEAVQMLGIFSGIALVVAYMPTLFTGALTHTLTMRISSDWINERFQHFYEKRNKAINLTWVWGWASSWFIFNFSSEIAQFLFRVPSAEPSIKLLALLPLIVGLREITTSLLWAQNQKRVPLMGLALGIVVNFTILYVVAAQPGLGYLSMSLGVIALELIATIWNFKVLQLFQYFKSRIVLFLIDLLFFELLIIVCTWSSNIINDQPYSVIIELLLYLIGSAVYIKFRFKGLLED